MYLSMMVISIKQHLNKIWSPVHEKVKPQWGWVQKSVAYKKACIERGLSLIKEILWLAHVKYKVDLKKQKSGERSW